MTDLDQPTSSADSTRPDTAEPRKPKDASGWGIGTVRGSVGNVVAPEISVVRELSLDEYEQILHDNSIILGVGPGNPVIGIDRVRQALHQAERVAVEEWDPVRLRFGAGSGRILAGLIKAFALRVSDTITKYGTPNAALDSSLVLLSNSPRIAVALMLDGLAVTVRPSGAQNAPVSLQGLTDRLFDKSLAIWHQHILRIEAQLRAALIRLRKACSDVLDGAPYLLKLDQSKTEMQNQNVVPVALNDTEQVMAQLHSASQTLPDQPASAVESIGQGNANDKNAAPHLIPEGEDQFSSEEAEQGRLADSDLLDLTMMVLSVSNSTEEIRTKWSDSLATAVDDTPGFGSALSTLISVFSRLTVDLSEWVRSHGIDPDIPGYPLNREATNRLLVSENADTVYQRTVVAKVEVFRKLLLVAGLLRSPSAMTLSSDGSIEASFWDHGALTALNMHLDSLAQCLVEEFLLVSGTETRRGALSIHFQRTEGTSVDIKLSVDTSALVGLRHLRTIAHLAMRTGDFAGCVFHVCRFVTAAIAELGQQHPLAVKLSDATDSAGVLWALIYKFVTNLDAQESVAVLLAQQGVVLLDEVYQYLDTEDEGGISDVS